MYHYGLEKILILSMLRRLGIRLALVIQMSPVLSICILNYLGTVHMFCFYTFSSVGTLNLHGEPVDYPFY